MKALVLSILLLATPVWAGMDYRPADSGGSPTGSAGGDLSGTFPNPTVAKVNGNTPGNTCTNQLTRSIDSSGRGTCATVISTDTDNTIAKTGTDVNTSNQVTATHLAAALPVNQGGTGTTSTLTGLVRGNASAMTAAELSGDASTSGSNAVTVSKLNNVTVGRNYLAAFATGVLSALPSASSEYNCFKAQTNDTVLNGEVAFDGSTLTCVSGPTVALQDCGVSTSCSGPTTRLSVQISSGSVNTITDMTVQNSGTITAGNYYCWEVSAGTCATVTGGFSGSAVLQ